MKQIPSFTLDLNTNSLFHVITRLIFSNFRQSRKMTRVAVVTGSNKGIGYATVKGLADKFNGDVYLTARNPELGMAAVAELLETGRKVHFHQLDITDPVSIRRLKEFMLERYKGIDVLVNNAGIAFKVASTEPLGVQAEVTLKTNYWAVKNTCDLLFPILKPGARVVNVSSSRGSLTKIPGQELKNKLGSDGLTISELDDLVTDFVARAKNGTHQEKGWPNSAYIPSKVALSALTRIQQREFDADPDSDLVINHVHPGFVNTDMSSHKGPLSIEEGARSSIFAATLPPLTEVKGKYIWEDCEIIPWGN